MNKPTRFLKYCTLSLCIFLVAGCGADPELVEATFEKYLKVDVPSEFKIVEYKEGGWNDYIRLYRIVIADEDMAELLKQVDLTDWELYQNYTHTKDIRVSKENSSELILLFIDPRANMLSYTHTWE